MKETIKKILIALTLILSIQGVGNSQTGFGAGITYLNELGVQARYGIAFDNFNFIPKFTYYIVDDVTSLSLELDAAYDLVTIGDDIPVYVFGGPAIYRSSANGFTNTDLAVTIGAGTVISRFYGEFKYGNLFCDNCDGQMGFAVGYMF